MNDMTSVNDPHVVNGLNVDDLLTLIDSVRSDPAQGLTHWRVSTTWRGQTHSRSEVTGYGLGGKTIERRFSFDIDEPAELGGGDRFSNPQEYLIGALNACMTVGYVAQCAIRGIKLESLRIETEGYIDLRGFLGIDGDVANGYESLTYEVHIKGDASDEVFEDIHQAVMATSPNFFNLSTAIKLNPKLVVDL